MNAIQWLEQNAKDFAALTEQERSALMHFSLLWSYFEAEALRTDGSSDAIAAWIRDLSGRGDLAKFSPMLEYFKKRYFAGGEFTHHFYSLNLRNNDNPTLVKAVLSDKDTDPVNSTIALFITIYRFRNNYFHGPKWAYALRDQLNNFNAANCSIMLAMDIWRR